MQSIQRSYSLFRKMLSPYPVSKKQIEKILPFFEEKNFKDSEYVFIEGEKGTDFYLVIEGCVEISKRMEKEGERKVLGVLKNGDFFGEMSFFTKEKRVATAKTLSDTQLLILNRDRFLKLVSEHPNTAIFFLLGLLEVTSGRLQDMDLELVALYDFGRLIVGPEARLEGLLGKILSKLFRILACKEIYFVLLNYPEGTRRIFSISDKNLKENFDVDVKDFLPDFSSCLDVLTKSSHFYLERDDKLVVAVKNVRRKLIGMIVFLPKKGKSFSENNTRLAAIVAEQLGSIIESFLGVIERADKEKLRRKWVEF